MNNKELTAVIQGRVSELIAKNHVVVTENLRTALSELSENIENFVALCKGEISDEYYCLCIKAIVESLDKVYLRSRD